MTIFKTFFKILSKQKGIIILYTVILLAFTSFSTKTKSNNFTFTSSKPNIAIVNKDGNTKVVKNFISYLDKNTTIKEIEGSLDDAIFYQRISAIIYIDKGYTKDYLANKDPKLNVKFTSSASSTYAEMIINKYMKAANIINDYATNDKDITKLINDSLKENSKVEMKSQLDIDSLSRASYFYSFANYSILSICIYLIALVLIKFNDDNIKKRNIVSSKKNSSILFELYKANIAFVLIVWVFLVILSIFIVGDVMFTANGLLLMLNSLVFIICALSIGFLVGNITKNQNAVSAVVNVVGSGSSFLCGCFVPVDFLPAAVLKLSKILPSYYYIKNNDLISTMETIDIKPLLINMSILVLFTILFIVITNIITNKKRKIA